MKEAAATVARAKIARLPVAQRVWAVSSVHGEAARLVRLHDAISARFRDGDCIVYLGNYLGHGEAVAESVDELLDFRRRVLSRQRGFCCDVVYLRGAQEEMWQKLLQLQFAQNPGALLEWMVRNGTGATIRAYGGELRHGFAATRDGPRTITRWTTSLRASVNARPGHVMLFSALRHAAVTQEGGLLFVNAAVDPGRPLTAQRDSFWWGDKDILELSAPYGGFRRVVRGFDRSPRGLVESDFAVSIDAGAGRGGGLMAACFARNGTVVEAFEA